MFQVVLFFLIFAVFSRDRPRIIIVPYRLSASLPWSSSASSSTRFTWVSTPLILPRNSLPPLRLTSTDEPRARFKTSRGRCAGMKIVNLSVMPHLSVAYDATGKKVGTFFEHYWGESSNYLPLSDFLFLRDRSKLHTSRSSATGILPKNQGPMQNLIYLCSKSTLMP